MAAPRFGAPALDRWLPRRWADHGALSIRFAAFLPTTPERGFLLARQRGLEEFPATADCRGRHPHDLPDRDQARGAAQARDRLWRNPLPVYPGRRIGAGVDRAANRGGAAASSAC